MNNPSSKHNANQLLNHSTQYERGLKYEDVCSSDESQLRTLEVSPIAEFRAAPLPYVLAIVISLLFVGQGTLTQQRGSSHLS